MKTPAEWKTLFESSAFARQTNYSGPLGPEYNPSGTRLRLWAPTAQKVSVNLYRRGDGGACMGTLPLEQHGQGVWSVYLPGDQHGHYYTFTVEVDGTAYETGDPYARTAGVNGLRSMILDAPRIDPPDWNHDHRVIVPASRRTVWEVSVRDFSQDPACGVRNAWRGKFMAFTQKGTTLSSAGTFPTCLDYLKRLGVGYVQLMPIFDFGSVDESRPLTRQYNWGYDPTNYNVPEGSYSTDPAKGEVRVRECKEMIASLHAAGIGVIMDVVYNHMYRNENPLNSTVPYYFFRQNPDGSFSNGSGCGNEFASERPMARKYLIDSVLYWAQEYHIDGFRFDLMGLYDVDTMNELRAALGPVLQGAEGSAFWPLLPSWPTLQPLAELLLDTPQFFTMFWNTCAIVFPQVLGQVLVGAPAAWAFSRLRFRGRRALFTLYIVLMLMPFQVTMVSGYLVADAMGIMDTFWAIILPGAFSTFPVFIMAKGFDAVPIALLEAASIDGAGPLRTFFHIGVPLGVPGILSAAVLGFLEAWNAIEQPMTFLKTKALWPLSLYLPQIAAEKLGLAMVASLVMLAPAVLIFRFGQKYLELGIQASGLKE